MSVISHISVWHKHSESSLGMKHNFQTLLLLLPLKRSKYGIQTALWSLWWVIDLREKREKKVKKQEGWLKTSEFWLELVPLVTVARGDGISAETDSQWVTWGQLAAECLLTLPSWWREDFIYHVSKLTYTVAICAIRLTNYQLINLSLIKFQTINKTSLNRSWENEFSQTWFNT